MTSNERKGLKSLKKRVANGEIFIADFDKSKTFAVLSHKQFIDAGMVHAGKDLQIVPHQVKKLQKSVNDHVSWARDGVTLSDR